MNSEPTDATDDGEDTQYHSEEEEFYRFLGVLGAFVGGGIIGVLAFPSDPLFGFMFCSLIFGMIFWLFATDDGRQFMENLAQEMEQSIDQSSGSKRICQNCGWQNPMENNFCHDCGTELGSEDNDAT